MATSPPNIKATLWMLGSVASFLAMAVAGREATRSMHVFQVMEMRSIIGFFILLPLVWKEGGLRAMLTRRPLAHIGRNVVHYAGQFAWLLALALIPLAEMIAIEFTTPIWTAILAVVFLGERLGRAKVAAIALGVIGVVVIVRPGLQQVEPGHIVMLACAVAFGISLVMVKSLTRTESVVRIIFWMLVIQSLIGLIPALLAWTTPTAAEWPWIVLISFTGMSSHFCMARALSYADATAVIPIDFLRVPLSALLGWLIYSEGMDLFTAVGAGLILGGNLLNLQRRPPKPAEAATA